MRQSRYRTLITGALLVILTLCWASVAAAGYNPDGDRTIRITVPNDHFPLGEDSAQESFERHQRNNERIEQNTGREREWSCIWIEVNGKRVLCADPPKPMFG